MNWVQHARVCSRELLKLEINHQYVSKATPALKTQRAQNKTCKQTALAPLRSQVVQASQAINSLGIKVEIDIILLGV